MSKMKDKFENDRPREKMAQKGARALSDAELIQVLIGAGQKGNDVTKISRAVNKLLTQKGTEASLDDLLAIPGISLANASKFLAAFELAQRKTAKPDGILDSPERVVQLLNDIRDKRQEYFVLLTLDGANRLINKHIITIGTLTASLVHPREVFAPAIEDRVASIIVAHNHPSGNLEPSSADCEVTKRLKEVGELLGIDLIDHIIVTKDAYRSII